MNVQFDFGVVLIFLVSAVGFALTNILLGVLLRPRFPNPEKEMIYECGERPFGGAWMNFNPRFYVIALVFVIFEVEVALTIPVARVFRDWIHSGGAEGRSGVVALLEILVFIAILASGLIWIWARRDLEWIKRIEGGHGRQ